ncbi:MAG: hypothetical protein ACK5L6_13635, partial [Anaerorhabdus sp.]|uniref:hypothetical protein n=1 Tax=Anaerorhabdus sp. TaxID=1872524 RepID=UPI003A83E913
FHRCRRRAGAPRSNIADSRLKPALPYLPHLSLAGFKLIHAAQSELEVSMPAADLPAFSSEHSQQRVAIEPGTNFHFRRARTFLGQQPVIEIGEAG